MHRIWYDQRTGNIISQANIRLFQHSFLAGLATFWRMDAHPFKVSGERSDIDLHGYVFSFDLSGEPVIFFFLPLDQR